jgi:hypothetical protein
MKKRLLAILAVLAVALVGCTEWDAEIKDGQSTVFGDEFNGSLDTSKWHPNWYGGTGATNPPNGAMTSCWSPSNITVANSQLHLALTSADCLGEPYTGSGIVSRGAMTWAPPMRFMARVKFPNSSGRYINWPAFWVTGSGDYGTCAGWPYGGEYDVAEGLGDTALRAVTHSSSSCSGSDSSMGQTLSTQNDGQFHVYRVDLSRGSGSCSSPFTSVRIQYSRDSTFLSAYDRCINVGAGYDVVLQHSTGTWGGTSVAPAMMDVDWVSVTAS